MKLHYLAIVLFLFFATRVRADDDFCFQCHGVQEGTSVTFKDDVHYANTISCADCHGGDPKINDMDKSKAPEKGFRVRVQRKDVPLYCAGCHSNAKFMAKFKPDLPTNQLALYTRSVHGQKLTAGKTAAAQCIDCHGIHDIKAGTDAKSPVYRRNVTDTCGKCHAEAAKSFRGTRHDGRATCVTCHGGHSAQEATPAMLTGDDSVCLRCHRAGSGQLRTAGQIADLLTTLQNAGPGSKEALTRARQAVHSLNVAAIRHAADSAPSTQPAAPAASPPTGGR